MAGFGWQDLLIIAVIVALIFGVGKIANVGPALGKAISGFKCAAKEGEKEADSMVSEVKKLDAGQARESGCRLGASVCG